jgi:hypothetical protein
MTGAIAQKVHPALFVEPATGSQIRALFSPQNEKTLLAKHWLRQRSSKRVQWSGRQD